MAATPRFIARSWNWFVVRSKWPVAVLFAIWTPLLFWAWYQLLLRIIAKPTSIILYTLGLVLFVFAWRSYLRYNQIWRYLAKAEHEATHYIFAVITGQKRQSLVSSMESSATDRLHDHDLASNERTQGQRWLMDVAPYFFPTSAILLWCIALFVPLGFLGWTSLALGFATGFHLVSTVREIRADRAELLALDWRFCWLFLPAANLLFTGLLVAFAQNGIEGMFAFVRDSLFVFFG